MSEVKRSFWRRHRWLLWCAGIAAVVLITTTAVLTVLAHRVEPFLRAQIVQGLQDRFHTRVELDTFHVSVHHGEESRWGIWATGQGLRIWPPHRADGNPGLEAAVESQPLIRLKEFGFHVPLRYETAKVVKIAQIQIKGLEIHIPPKSERDKQSGFESAMDQSTRKAQQKPSGPHASGILASVLVRQVVCDRAQLVIETDKPNKVPMTFDISHMTLKDITADKAVAFEAFLINPKPHGEIHTTGNFGPWDADDPGESPVSGNYQFTHADMSVFKGLAGTLSSIGEYQGTLRNIHVNGDADVPDFQLTHLGNPTSLQTRFHARVDGTDGDTWLDDVQATLGHSHFSTRGQIVRNKLTPAIGEPVQISEGGKAVTEYAGHQIDLKIDIPHARIEDFLHLTSHSPTPLLTGNVASNAMLHIPPGKEPVHLRIKLDGSFKLNQAHFTDDKVQEKVESLSLRSQGHPGDTKTADPDSVTSEMESDFHVNKGVIALPDLQYTVPGAHIQLNGTYAMDGAIHFDGMARMDATVSQMVGGWKGFLLKPADRLFKKDGAGAEIPIKIRGTRDHPDFGLDFHRLKKTSPETPGEKK